MGGVDIIGSTPSFLFTSTWATAKRMGLFEMTMIIANVLLLYFITSQALQAALSGKGEMLRSLFVRAVLAAALLSSTGWVQGVMADTWYKTWDLTSRLSETVSGTATTDLAEGLDGLVGDNGKVAILAAANFILDNSDAIEGAAGAAAGATAVTSHFKTALRPLVSQGLKWLTRAFRLLVIPLVVLFLVLTFASGLVVTLSAAMLPIAAAMMASGGGGKMFQGLVTKTIGAYASLLAIPLAVSALFQMAIFAPLLAIIDQINTAAEAAAGIFDFEWDDNQGWWHNLTRAVGEIMGNLGEAMDAVFMIAIRGVAMVLGGMIGAFMAMRSIEGYIAKIVGGVASGATNTVSHLGFGDDLKKEGAQTVAKGAKSAGKATVQGVKNIDNKLAQGSVRAAETKARGFSEPSGGSGRNAVSSPGPQSRQSNIERLRNSANS